jgi:thymidine phosphorylase
MPHPAPLPAEVIGEKRAGRALSDAQIESFVRGLVDRRWSDAQAAALAMAICLRGMDAAETVSLTRAMAHSGRGLDGSGAGLPGPVVDKHSTGGVGDKVSLVLAPVVAACGAVVPMISGHGLGHTGGTLDKLESLPGYAVMPGAGRLRRVLRDAGCAIVGAGPQLAPADRRLYALRDVTATVESVPLITASILSKKLAAGLQSLVLDVKVGNGAFCPTMGSARALATCLVTVAQAVGLPTLALLTDMNEVLGSTAGNALEAGEAIDRLCGEPGDARLRDVTLALGGAMLASVGLAASEADGRARCADALERGLAAEGFERMIRGLGGPGSACGRDRRRRPRAPVQVDVVSERAGQVTDIDTRALRLVVVRLGGGRVRPGDPVDPRAGLSAVVGRGARVGAGDRLARVHAGSRGDLEWAVPAVSAAFRIGPRAAAGSTRRVVLGRIGPTAPD